MALLYSFHRGYHPYLNTGAVRFRRTHAPYWGMCPDLLFLVNENQAQDSCLGVCVTQIYSVRLQLTQRTINVWPDRLILAVAYLLWCQVRSAAGAALAAPQFFLFFFLNEV